MNTTFHHGGRIGDLIYALYTVKELGGGDIYMSLFHNPGWNKQMIDSLIPLLEYQDYIGKADMCMTPPNFGVDIMYDLHHAEDMFNPEDFPEWEGPIWPGDISIQKRYAVAFDCVYDPEAIWLTAPRTKKVDIVFHMPLRRCVSSIESWVELLINLSRVYKIVVLGGQNDIHEWKEYIPSLNYVVPSNHLETADWINSADLFLGGASSCNVIAEALKKFRMVELAGDCHNIFAKGKTGFTINSWNKYERADMVCKLIGRSRRNVANTR